MTPSMTGKKNKSSNLSKLDYDPNAYKYLEYISLEYPSQTIIKDEFEDSPGLIISQCNGENSSIIQLNFNDLDSNADFNHNKYDIDCEINRLKMNNNFLIGTSDKKAFIMNKNFEIQYEFFKNFSYGLDLKNNLSIFGTQKGKILIFDILKNDKKSLKIHEKEINSLKLENNLIFTASNDYFLKITDLRTNEKIKEIKNNSDINSIDILENNLIYGDDKGKSYFYDIRSFNLLEKIENLISPINSILFTSIDSFLTVSDHQISFYDLSLLPEENWPENQFLYFKHMGQSFYKEICRIDDKFCVTSADGICIFKPVDEIESDSSLE